MSYVDQENESQSVWAAGAGVAGAIGGLALTYFVGLAPIVVMATTLAGVFVGAKLRTDRDVDRGWPAVVVGLNLISWIVPFLGGLTGGLAFAFSDQSARRKMLYWILGAVGILLGIANAALPAVLRQYGYDI